MSYDAENRLVGVSGAASAVFVYDGDGKRVKATLNSLTTTYIGNYYETSGNSVRKYYFFGALRVAMRQDSNLFFLLGDHLGSSSLSYQVSNGATIPQYYKPWGEIRPGPNNSLPTDYTFTRQKWEASLSLMFFNSRWYDSSLGRFIEPDTIIPASGSTQALDRYAYAENDPVRYVDPTGHRIERAIFAGDADFVGAQLYGIKFTGNWSLKRMLTVLDAVSAVAHRFAEITRGRASDAFRNVFNTSTTNPLEFHMGCSDCTRLGQTVNDHRIDIRDFYADAYPDKALRDGNLIVHELGHVFDSSMGGISGNGFSPSQVLAQRQSLDRSYPNRLDIPRRNYGFASPSGVFTWQQSTDHSQSEEFADQFLGWTFDKWDFESGGRDRQEFMNAYMNLWVSATGY